ncbi:uncharacterized protein LOC121746074 [Salvia splendens]|uniref:uncharacterized protein LOC121746074 n=1 Tax=Salvia splendens TaxID=180675 RepID=UPI001C260315|nr:uncharacterized protein LOC121746074 [Salvia splendens]
MATAMMIETQSNAAEIHRGPISGKKLHEMLDEFSIPRCLFAGVVRIEEFGFNRAAGFYWVKQEKKTERKVDKVGMTYYDTQLTSFITPGRLSKITGVKAKEIILTLTVTDIVVGVPSSDKVKFVTSTGIYRVHPIAAFEPVVKINGK